MLQRHKLEIDRLHRRPEHPISRQRARIRTLQLFRRGGAFEDGHGREEAEEIGGCENALVGDDFGEDFEVLVLEDYAPLEEGEPDGCCGPEDHCAVVLVGI